LNQRLSVDECMQALDECGAPAVSIARRRAAAAQGDARDRPRLHRTQEVRLSCTNALLLEKKIDDYEPNRYFTWSVHLDGDREDHDKSVCQDGVYERAVAAIRKAKERGFRVTINCTLFDNRRRRALCALLRRRHGDGRRRDHGLARLRL